jgi:hypothetical protein
MYSLQIHGRAPTIDGTPDRETVIYLGTWYNAAWVDDNSKLPFNGPGCEDITNVVEYIDVSGTVKLEYILRTESAYILNSQGKTFQTVRKAIRD